MPIDKKVKPEDVPEEDELSAYTTTMRVWSWGGILALGALLSLLRFLWLTFFKH